jgi:transketolase
MSVVDAVELRESIRRIVLEQSQRANVGHIGSCLSVADILAVLYGGVLTVPGPDDPERDRFILSKGHAGLALFAALHVRGWLSAEQLNSFCRDASLLGVHPERDLPGVDFSTGSLGHGLSMGAGAALAARLQHSSRRVFVLLSDAECNEGATWEAIMFASHHGLTNLVAIVDLNGQQALGHTADVLDLRPLRNRWAAFGWDVSEVDGHDTAGLSTALNTQAESGGSPRVVIARTVFGKGVSFMEGQVRWHYLPMTDAEYDLACHELAVKACVGRSSTR